MNYGKGAAPSIAGVALLPNTGDNTLLFAVAAGMIAAGVVVLVVSLVLSRKNRSAN